MVNNLPIWSHNNQKTANNKPAMMIASKIILHREKPQQQRCPENFASISHITPPTTATTECMVRSAF
jgi:hypothetical protein